MAELRTTPLPQLKIGALPQLVAVELEHVDLYQMADKARQQLLELAEEAEVAGLAVLSCLSRFHHYCHRQHCQ